MNKYKVKVGYYPKGYKMVQSSNGEYVKYSEVKRTLLNEQQRKEFAKAAKPLMQFLENPERFHPHFTVILDSTHAELVEGCAMIREDCSWGTCGFCQNDGLITKDPDGLMCNKCWDNK